ncbi:MAG: helix-turn-helix domain-containing protein [Pseudonocardiaceae bacterium]|jgi:excisionase family DNA binding protein
MGNVALLNTEIIDPDDPVSFNDVPVSQVYTVREVATLLGINLGVTYELIRQRKIPAKRLGKRWIVPRRLFHVWLNNITQEGS